MLVTGRRFNSARTIADQLPGDLVIIASNGALVRAASGETLSRTTLPRSSTQAVIQAARPWRRNTLLIFDHQGRGELVAEGLDSSHAPVARYLERQRSFLQVVTDLEAALTTDPLEVFFIGSCAPLRSLHQKLQEIAATAGIGVALTEYPDRDLTLIDVVAVGCDKGTALMMWAQGAGILPSQIMAVGDNWGDVPMLEAVGLPVLMGNSSPELKKRGWALTTTSEEDGVAAAIEKYILRG